MFPYTSHPVHFVLSVNTQTNDHLSLRTVVAMPVVKDDAGCEASTVVR